MTWAVPPASADPALDWEISATDEGGSVLLPPSVVRDIGELNGGPVRSRAFRPSVSPDGLSHALPYGTGVRLGGLKGSPPHLSSSAGQGEGAPLRGHSDAVVGTAFSPDGRALVSAGLDGRVVLWAVPHAGADGADGSPNSGGFVAEVPSTVPAAATVTSLLWTDAGTLFLASSDGSVSIVDGIDEVRAAASAAAATPVSSSIEAAYDSDATQEVNDPAGDNRAAQADGQGRLRKVGGGDGGKADSDDDVDFGAPSEGGDGAEKKRAANQFVADEADEADEADDEDGANNDRTGDDAVGTQEDDQADERLMPDDKGDLHGEDTLEDILEEGPIRHGDDSRYETIAAPEMQPAFAVSSTPLTASTTRLLCWNHVGTLTLRDEGPTNTVEIGFADGAFRRPVSFTDNLRFIVGSLGDDGGIFASDISGDDYEEDDDVDEIDGLNMSDATKSILKRSSRRKKKGGAGVSTGSSVYFHRFETFGPMREKDWVLTLPDGEGALGCACGEGWAAVATSRRFLRMYSSGGNQGPVIWLGGDVVTMVGRGRFLAVFCHEATPLPDGTQRIGYQILDGLSGGLVSSGSVSAISPGSTLSWAGFSNDYSLVVMDSDGMVSMLAAQTSTYSAAGGSWMWSPMLDTVGLRKSHDDCFWPVSCQDGKFVCVPLKGGNEHPDAARRPVTTALGFRMPLAYGALSKFNALEDLQVRADLSLRQKKFVNESTAPDDEELMAEYDAMCAQVDKVTLKLFFEILKAGKVERALDLVDRLQLEKSFEIAVKASDRLSFFTLSDRIEVAKEDRFPIVEEEQEQELEDVDRRYFAQNHPGPELTSDMKEIDDTSSSAITPETGRRKRNIGDTMSDDDEPEEDVPEEKPAQRRRVNPFAKQRLESPSKPRLGKENDFTSPLRSPSAKPALSRASTFSAQSRAMKMGKKRLL